MSITVGKAIKELESRGFQFLNQVGSHRKYGKGSERVTLVFHSSPKEILHKKTEKELKTLLKRHDDKSRSSGRLT